MSSYLSLLIGGGCWLPSTFNMAATYAMYDAYARATKYAGKRPEEPDFVASLVQVGVISIKRALDIALAGSGIRVTTTGVFCHQSPMVEFPARCELGDILFVHSHTGASGIVQRNALLLQAKMTKPAAKSTRIAKKDIHQLHLYESWPPFTYDMQGDPLHGQSRMVVPNARHAGAQYLLIDKDPVFVGPGTPHGNYPMAVWMAENPVYTKTTLGDSLFDFFSMTSGRLFGPKSAATGWTQVVWDLIDNGLRKGFNRARTGRVASENSRLSGDSVPPNVACFSAGFGAVRQSLVHEVLGASANVLRRAGDGGQVPPELMSEFDFDEPPSGISLVIVETDESQVQQG